MKGMAAACFIHDAAWRSSRSSTDATSTPRVALPIPIGVTGGSGSSTVPRMNINFTWPTNAPDEKHLHVLVRFEDGAAVERSDVVADGIRDEQEVRSRGRRLLGATQWADDGRAVVHLSLGLHCRPARRNWRRSVATGAPIHAALTLAESR